MNDQIEIKDLDQGVPEQLDWLVFQKVSDGVVYKAPKSDIEGEDSFVYIGYADDDIGTGFTPTYNANKDYIAIKSTNTEIANPVVGDFAGLWKNYKGIKGDTGDNATADAGTTTTIAPGQPATVTNVGTTSDAVFDFAIPQGEKGACVVSVAFVGNDMVFTLDDTSTVTLVGAKTDLEGDKGDTGASIVSVAFNGNDIVFTKDDLTTVTLTNGKTILTGPKGDTGVGITSIVKTSTLGLVDTYTINYDDTTTTTFNVTNGAKGDTGDTGNGIASVVKTATVGLVDTYTITFTDLTTFEYDVTNGKDGLGSGDVSGPASAVDENIAVFDQATGKLIKDGGKKISELQLALGYTAENIANKSTNITTDGASDTKYPSVKAVKDYADGLVVGLWDDRGSYDASGNVYPSTGGSGTAGAILKGDIWTISVTGTLGGVAVAIGDTVRALTDTPGQTSTNWSILENNIGYVPENVANKVISFQVTPDDSHYPSEKLVKDSLDTKAPLASPTFTGLVTAPAIKLTTGASLGKVLTSDADGDATWADPATSLTKATQAEVATGTDDTKYVTPLAIQPYSNNSLYRQAIINGNFDVWQRGTSISVGASAYTYTCDRFKAFSANTATIVSQSTDVPAGFRYSLKLQRPNGNTGTNLLSIGQIIETANATYLAGKAVTLSFWAKVGANYSGGAMSVQLLTGTAADQGGDPYSWTGLATAINSTSFTPTTTWARYTYTGTIASNALEVMENISITPTGTAGADDALYITGVQLNAGSVALPFQPKSFAEELRDCQRYYQTRVVRTINGIMNYGLPVNLRTTPTVATASAGTIANAISTGYQITHNANADSTVVLSAEL